MRRTARKTIGMALAFGILSGTSCTASTDEYALAEFANARVSIYCLDEDYDGYCVLIDDPEEAAILKSLYEENRKESSYGKDGNGPLGVGALYISVDRYSVWFDDDGKGFSWGMSWDEENGETTYFLSSLYQEETKMNEPYGRKTKAEESTYLVVKDLYEKGCTDENAIHSSAPFLPSKFEYTNAAS